jgi:hypothetical protein
LTQISALSEKVLAAGATGKPFNMLKIFIFKKVMNLSNETVNCKLMTHSAGSVTTQSIALKQVMAFEPYRYT